MNPGSIQSPSRETPAMRRWWWDVVAEREAATQDFAFSSGGQIEFSSHGKTVYATMALVEGKKEKGVRGAHSKILSRPVCVTNFESVTPSRKGTQSSILE